jgi:hypothetical protein
MSRGFWVWGGLVSLLFGLTWLGANSGWWLPSDEELLTSSVRTGSLGARSVYGGPGYGK